jgi:hypothetical protein
MLHPFFSSQCFIQTRHSKFGQKKSRHCLMKQFFFGNSGDVVNCLEKMGGELLVPYRSHSSSSPVSESSRCETECFKIAVSPELPASCGAKEMPQ